MTRAFHTADPDTQRWLLAHELGHFRHGSSGETTQFRLCLALAVAAALAGPTLQAVTGRAVFGFGLTVGSGFLLVAARLSRRQELAADAAAARTLSRAGLDPVALAAHGLRHDPEAGTVTTWLVQRITTHPTRERRLQAVQDQAARDQAARDQAARHGRDHTA